VDAGAWLLASRTRDCMLERMALAAKILIWSIETPSQLQVVNQNGRREKSFILLGVSR
jgi:hypothetical protein